MRILSPKQVQSLGSEVVEPGWEPIFQTRKLCALMPVISVCFGGSFQALQAGGALGELGFPQEGSRSALGPHTRVLFPLLPGGVRRAGGLQPAQTGSLISSPSSALRTSWEPLSRMWDLRGPWCLEPHFPHVAAGTRGQGRGNWKGHVVLSPHVTREETGPETPSDSLKATQLVSGQGPGTRSPAHTTSMPAVHFVCSEASSGLCWSLCDCFVFWFCP